MIDKRTSSVLFTILIFVIVLDLIYDARRPLPIIIFSVLFAYLLEPLVTWFQRRFRGSRTKGIVALPDAAGAIFVVSGAFGHFPFLPPVNKGPTRAGLDLDNIPSSVFKEGQKRMTKRKTRWLVAVGILLGVGFIGLITAGYVLACRFDPYIRQQAILYLQKRCDSKVELASLVEGTAAEPKFGLDLGGNEKAKSSTPKSKLIAQH